jgi:hypothetical protein
MQNMWCPGERKTHAQTGFALTWTQKMYEQKMWKFQQSQQPTLRLLILK